MNISSREQYYQKDQQNSRSRDNKFRVFVGNLSFKTTLRTLEEFFKNNVGIHYPVDRDTGRTKGYAFVTYGSEAEVEAALELTGKDLDGRPIRVDRVRTNPNAGNPGSGARRGTGSYQPRESVRSQSRYGDDFSSKQQDDEESSY